MKTTSQKFDTNKWSSPRNLQLNFEKLFLGVSYNENFYPIDFDVNTSQNDVFQKKRLNDFYLVNPPFYEDPQGKFEKPLSVYISFLINLAQCSNQSIALLVPVREFTKWFQEAEASSLICFVFFTTRFSFLQGVNLKPRRKTPNDNCLLVVGCGSEDLFVDNSLEPWKFQRQLIPEKSFLN